MTICYKTDSRYPYTYAADFLRMRIGNDYGKGLISRGAAAHATALIADVLNISSEEISKKLADAYIAIPENQR
jgi:hypothetical protein